MNFNVFIKGFLEKNGSGLLDKLVWIFEGYVIRLMEWFLGLLYRFWIKVYIVGFSLKFWKFGWWEGEFVGFLGLGI